MARVAGAVQRQKTRKCTGKIYSSEQLAKQLAGACMNLEKKTKVIERNEKLSWARARTRSIG